jgi:hypothetical protein
MPESCRQCKKDLEFIELVKGINKLCKIWKCEDCGYWVQVVGGEEGHEDKDREHNDSRLGIHQKT